jgi:hypothetical protein
MDESELMGRMEPEGGLANPFHRFVWIHRSELLDVALKIEAMEHFGNDVALAIPLACIERSKNVGVIDLCKRAVLSFETGGGFGRGLAVVSEEFDRDSSVEMSMMSFVNSTHASAAYLLNDGQVSDDRTDPWIDGISLGRSGRVIRIPVGS